MSNRPMYGRVLEADFELDTLTFEMESGYAAAAGRFAIVDAAEFCHLAQRNAELLESLREIAALPAHPMRKKAASIARAAIALAQGDAA